MATDQGSFKAVIDINGSDTQSNVIISDFDPNKQSNIQGLHQYSSKLLSLKVNRTFQYQALNAVGKDVNKDTTAFFQEAKSRVNASEVKNWFVNRYLYSAHEGA
ncbi:hypothetical protein J0J18_23835, partial [Vibrio vulnificus]|nr:hypothetical protein [Vibrio vulnificus]